MPSTRNPWAEVAVLALNPLPDGSGYLDEGGGPGYTWRSTVSHEGFDEMCLHARMLDRYGEALELLRQTYPVCQEHGVNLILEGNHEWAVDPYMESRWQASRGWPVFMFGGFHWRLSSECWDSPYCIPLWAQGLPDGSVVLTDAPLVNHEPRRDSPDSIGAIAERPGVA